MRNWKIRSFAVFLLAWVLVFSTVSILPAARSDTGNCITKCNQENKPLKTACRDAMQACKADCKELADQTDCFTTCNVAKAACDATAAFLKEQCTVACPRGENVSDGGGDPLP